MRTVPRSSRVPVVLAWICFLMLPGFCARSVSASGPTQAGGLPALAARVAELEVETADQAARIAALEVETTAQDARIALLESDNDELRSVLTVDASGDLVVSGANLRVQSGSGSTSGTPNGKGNLIVGYDESSGDTKTGSHNLVVGPLHTYTSSGGLVAGSDNRIDDLFASVTGGTNNRSSGFASSVTGGAFNLAAGARSSVSGGQQNIASGTDAAVGGGFQNTAAGLRTSVSGGSNCVQLAINAWGSGTSLGPLGVFPVGVTSPIFLCP